MLLSLLVSAVLQVLVFTAVPFITYVALNRRTRGFLRYVGLYGAERRTLWYSTAVAVLFTGTLLFLLWAMQLNTLATAPNTVVGRIRAIGPSGPAVVAMILYAVIQTSLAEEILFRGFLAKRLIGRLGFRSGNLLQAVLFGALHLLLFAGPGASAFTWMRATFIVGTTACVGWLLGAVNERRGNGSILPSWWAHALTNLVAYGVLAFGRAP